MDSVLFSPEDIEELQGRGIAMEEAEAQVHDIRSGFPYGRSTSSLEERMCTR